MYTPISCEYHDELLHYATIGKPVQIVYQEAEPLAIVGTAPNESSVEARIVDVFTRQKEEFIVLDSGILIRLDRLVSVAGKTANSYC